MKLAILNQPLANRGDEAAHKAFVCALAKALPDAQIDVVFIYAIQSLVDAMDVHLNNVRYISLLRSPRLTYRFERGSLLLGLPWLASLHPGLRRFKKTVECYDAVICAPGGICMGGFQNWDHVWQLVVAKRLHKPIFYWGRSIGSFSGGGCFLKKTFRRHSYSLLRYFSYISLRDSESVAIAKDAGVVVDEVVDSAFLDIPKALIPEPLASELNDTDYIVFVPNELTWHFRYRDIPQQRIDDFYLKLLLILEEKYPNTKIVMLPQTYNSPVNDSAYFERLRTLSRNPNIIVVDEHHSSDVQQAIIAGARLVVGARYHSVVFALNNNVPFISLSYEHKMKGLLEKLCLTATMVEIQDIFDDGADADMEYTFNMFRELIASEPSRPDSAEARQIVRTGFQNMLGMLRHYGGAVIRKEQGEEAWHIPG